MKADLCDRCGQVIYAANRAQPGRSAVRIYINTELISQRTARWYEFHADCVTGMTINDILNGGTA